MTLCMKLYLLGGNCDMVVGVAGLLEPGEPFPPPPAPPPFPLMLLVVAEVFEFSLISQVSTAIFTSSKV